MSMCVILSGEGCFIFIKEKIIIKTCSKSLQYIWDTYMIRNFSVFSAKPEKRSIIISFLLLLKEKLHKLFRFSRGPAFPNHESSSITLTNNNKFSLLNRV